MRPARGCFSVEIVVSNDGGAFELWALRESSDEARMMIDEWAVVARGITADVIVPLQSTHAIDDDAFLTFEWAPRVSLRALLKSDGARGGIAVPLVFALIDGVARGLTEIDKAVAAAVGTRVDGDARHRDLTHDAIGFGTDGRVRLEWRPAQVERVTGHRAGKYSFETLAPEEVRGLPTTSAADVFSLGAVAFHALAGVSPFRRDSDFATLEAIARGEIPHVADTRPDAPPELMALITAMIAREPKARPSIAELRAVLARELAWARWDAETIAREVRALAPRAVDDLLTLDDRVRAAQRAQRA